MFWLLKFIFRRSMEGARRFAPKGCEILGLTENDTELERNDWVAHQCMMQIRLDQLIPDCTRGFWNRLWRWARRQYQRWMRLVTRGIIQLICLGVIGIVTRMILFTGWHSIFATVPMDIGTSAARVKAFLITLVISAVVIPTACMRKEEE